MDVFNRLDNKTEKPKLLKFKDVLKNNIKILHREEETIQSKEALSRVTNNSLMVVGSCGVGRTKFVESLMDDISISNDTNIITYNAHEMFLNIQSKPQFEEKVDILIDRAVATNSIVFIDDFERYFKEYPGNDLGFSNLLEQGIINKGLQLIVCITKDAWSQAENDPFNKYFQQIFLRNFTKDENLDIIKRNLDVIASEQNLKYDANVINHSYDLAKRFYSNVSLPTSAIEILISGAANLTMKNDPFSVLTTAEKRKLKEYDKAVFLSKEKEDVSVEMKQLEEATKFREININIIKERKEYLDSIINKNDNVLFLDNKNLDTVVSRQTGIALNKLDIDEFNILQGLESKLGESVIGQQDAIKVLNNCLKRNTVGLKDPNKPMGVFMFVGNTGTGKTYLAKQLAKEYFGSEDNITILDMSEYSDKTSANKLFGSSPGYVGYEKGGILTNAVKEKPYSVLLLDEIEKADEIVHQTLLQVFDEGRMTDNKGVVASFKNTIIIMTSNVGTKDAANKLSISPVGFTEPTIDDNKAVALDVINSKIKKTFSPEFMNRVDNLVIFNDLDDADLTKILKLEIGKSIKRIGVNGYKFKINNSVYKHFINKEFNRSYGAREIIRVIRELEDLIADNIVSGKINNENLININTQKGEIVIEHGIK